MNFKKEMENISMNIKFYLTILIVATLGFSQESQGGEPYSFNNNLSRITPIFELPFVDSDALKTEDSENTPGSPFRYGIRLPVDFSPETSGSWETLFDGTRIWKLQIFSRGAYALNIGFDSFYLPKDSKLFIYNPDHSILYGAYTEMNNNVEEIFATPLLKGEEIILEYSEPADVSEKNKLHIEYVVHDYKDILNYSGERDRSCGVNVVCDEAAPYVDQYSATAWLDMNGWMCSGAMLNNTNQDLDALTVEFIERKPKPPNYTTLSKGTSGEGGDSS